MNRIRKNIYKIIAVFLAVVMIVGVLPVSASEYYDTPPEMKNTHKYSVFEREGFYWSDISVTGNTTIASGRFQYGYFNIDGSTIDTTEATYMEFDVWSDVDISNNLDLWLSCNVWEESGRALFRLPSLKSGWNHIVVDLNSYIALANFGAVEYDRAKIRTMFIRGVPKTENSERIKIEFANIAFTSDTAPTPENKPVHKYSVFEKDGLIYNWKQSAGETMNWTDYFAINGGNAVDISKAKYFEFDLTANNSTSNFVLWLSNSLGENPARKAYNAGMISKGNNHVVIDLSKIINSYETETAKWDKTKIKYILLEPFTPTENLDYKFSNFTFTTDENPNPDSPDKLPQAVYSNNDIIATRSIDLKGEKNNKLDERFFDWNTYSVAFADTIKNPLDITKANYLEFDFYSDSDGTVRMSLGSLHKPNGFQFYDNRSKQKSFEVKKGWNHIVLTTDKEYREIDTYSLKSYNPKAVTGFVLHGANAGYIRLTNVALTFSSFIDDPVLNYRDDFDWGVVMHTPHFGMPYRPANTETQIKQLADMGCKLLRIDATDDLIQLDKTVKLCNAYGIKVMLIVYLPDRTFDKTVSIDTEKIKKHYRTYTTRYDGKHGCGKIDYIQIDNELDVAIMHTTGIINEGSQIYHYDADALKTITKQVKAASEAIKESGTDAKRIINIGWIHFGIMKYFYLNGVEWDVSGHDWYQDMFGYGGNVEELYGAGQEYYNLFKKPIIICETNMWMNAYNGTTDYPDYYKSSWWDPLVKCLQNYYEKDYVIGCTVYEFYEEPMYQPTEEWYGEAHFGMMEIYEDGTFKSAKPIYYRLKHLYGGEDVSQFRWIEIEDDYSIYDCDMLNLVKTKNSILKNNNFYHGDCDFYIDGIIDSLDFTTLKKMLFEKF